MPLRPANGCCHRPTLVQLDPTQNSQINSEEITDSRYHGNMMLDTKALDAYYRTLADLELLKLSAEGGLTEEAERAVRSELARRNMTPDDAKRHFAPEWLENLEAGTVGVLTLEGGERVTAEVAGLNEDSDYLNVKVLSPGGLSRAGSLNDLSISLDQIVSLEVQPHLKEQWPFSDPCQDRSFSSSRFILMTAILLCMMGSSLIFFLFLKNKPYGIQEASIIFYTLGAAISTFASSSNRFGRDYPPFKFTCPAVEPQIPRLLGRHLGFLVALLALQTALLAVRLRLPDWWNVENKKGDTPFDAAFILLCFGLLSVQVWTNRRLLDRAHREFSA
jgi:hypothetical protein